MDIYKRKSRWKWYLALTGLFIVAISMIFTGYLTEKLAEEERKKVEQLKTAVERITIQREEEEECDVTFISEFITLNTTIPILWVNDADEPVDAANFGVKKDTSAVFRQKKLAEFKAAGRQPVIVSTPYFKQYMYFEHSFILKLLTYYPIFQFILIAAFITFGYFAFSSARRAEQNRVWVGMAKETAHQLGTPIMAILAWIDHLKSIREEDEEVNEVVGELRNDVTRLELIAERFSKIGSAPKLEPINVYEELEKCRTYMQRRAPRKVLFEFPEPTEKQLDVHINPHLFDWVVENLLRNSLDAMDGKGKISADVYEDSQFVYIDISDTGKGIPSSKQKTVFEPGFTTKKRGWGLGLSLAKRIIEEYHSGRIFVKKSTENVGTTFTIKLPKK